MLLDTFANQVLDPVGSGDALLAYATLSMLATNYTVCATIIGLIGAAYECEMDGNIQVTTVLVLAKLHSIQRQMNFGSAER